LRANPNLTTLELNCFGLTSLPALSSTLLLVWGRDVVFF
jgi:hypothetical protein